MKPQDFIVYRNYQIGDDAQLADLFNKAFQMNGGGFLRTAKNWNWRYVQSPDFEPDMIQIAEDTTKSLIVGAILVNLVEPISINNKKYLVGDINDVSCHPDYTRKGIATKLMQMAVDYMKKKNCDISILTAATNGFPRKKIYLKFDYVDINEEIMLISFSNILKLIKDVIPIAFLTPALLVLSYCPRFIYRIIFKISTPFRNFSYEIIQNKKHLEYMRTANKFLMQNYTGFLPYNPQKFIWARIKVSGKRHKPTYILIKKQDRIIGGATLTHINYYSVNKGIKIRMGLIHEIFMDKSQFKTKKELNLGYVYLIDKIMKAATQRFIGLLTFTGSSSDSDVHSGFRSMGFFKISSGTIMMRILKKEITLNKLEKPFYLPTYLSLGVP